MFNKSIAQMFDGYSRAMLALAAATQWQGHRVGPGKRSVLTYHRQIEKARARRLERRLAGRYVWP